MKCFGRGIGKYDDDATTTLDTTTGTNATKAKFPVLVVYATSRDAAISIINAKSICSHGS